MSSFVLQIPKKDKYIYRCAYCRKSYPDREAAEECVEGHRLVLVPLARDDLNRLVMFLYNKEFKLLTENLVNTLKRYNQKGTYEN